jgi:hypothetical protein
VQSGAADADLGVAREHRDDAARAVVDFAGDRVAAAVDVDADVGIVGSEHEAQRVELAGFDRGERGGIVGPRRRVGRAGVSSVDHQRRLLEFLSALLRTGNPAQPGHYPLFQKLQLAWYTALVELDQGRMFINSSFHTTATSFSRRTSLSWLLLSGSFRTRTWRAVSLRSAGAHPLHRASPSYQGMSASPVAGATHAVNIYLEAVSQLCDRR